MYMYSHPAVFIFRPLMYVHVRVQSHSLLDHVTAVRSCSLYFMDSPLSPFFDGVMNKSVLNVRYSSV